MIFQDSNLIVFSHLNTLFYSQVLGFIFLGANSNSFFQTVVLLVCVKNFPQSRGTVVGLLKGVTVLGAAIYSLIYDAFLSPRQDMFILMAMLTSSTIAILGTLLIHHYKPSMQIFSDFFLCFQLRKMSPQKAP